MANPTRAQADALRRSPPVFGRRLTADGGNQRRYDLRVELGSAVGLELRECSDLRERLPVGPVLVIAWKASQQETIRATRRSSRLVACAHAFTGADPDGRGARQPANPPTRVRESAPGAGLRPAKRPPMDPPTRSRSGWGCRNSAKRRQLPLSRPWRESSVFDRARGRRRGRPRRCLARFLARPLMHQERTSSEA
jgi:hypothetical protein